MRDYTNTYFCGVQAVQWYVDFLVWERMLNNHDDASRIIELGTEDGGLSLFLCLQAVQRGMDFYTFDNRVYSDGKPESFDLPLGRLLDLESRFYNANVFEEGCKLIEELIIESGTTILCCDNGDKPREFATFAPILKSGDLITVHDWNLEIKEEHIDYDIVDPVMDELLTRMGTLTRAFIKK